MIDVEAQDTWAHMSCGLLESCDRPSLLGDLVVGHRSWVAVIRHEVELSDPGQLERILGELRGMEGVLDAYRLVSTD